MHLIEQRTFKVKFIFGDVSKKLFDDSSFKTEHLGKICVVKLHIAAVKDASVWLEIYELENLVSCVALKNTLNQNQVLERHFLHFNCVDIVEISISIRIKLLLLYP